MSNYDSGGDLAKYAIWAVTAAIIAYSTGAGIAVLIGVATGLFSLAVSDRRLLSKTAESHGDIARSDALDDRG